MARFGPFGPFGVSESGFDQRRVLEASGHMQKVVTFGVSRNQGSLSISFFRFSWNLVSVQHYMVFALFSGSRGSEI